MSLKLLFFYRYCYNESRENVYEPYENHTCSTHSYLILFTIILAMLIGCSAKEKASAEPEVEVITARFTDPVELEPQPSDTCIACHTKTNPITKLASPTSAVQTPVDELLLRRSFRH